MRKPHEARTSATVRQPNATISWRVTTLTDAGARASGSASLEAAKTSVGDAIGAGSPAGPASELLVGCPETVAAAIRKDAVSPFAMSHPFGFRVMRLLV